jgi:two-component system invasion response regulator UvrY
VGYQVDLEKRESHEANAGARAPPIRVGIVDDHPITRSALRAYLDDQDDIEVKGEASSGREAIDLVRREAIDVLLLDLDMPSQNGIDALPMIKAKAAHVGVIILSGYPEQQYAVPLIRNGASGYLNKGCEPGEVVQAIRTVARGVRYITAGVAELLASQVLPPMARPAHEQLSTREFQVFIKLAQGMSPCELAAELSLSTKTVSTYRARLLAKLQCKSNSDLTYYALKHSLLE